MTDTITLTIPASEWMTSNGNTRHWAQTAERRRLLRHRAETEARAQKVRKQAGKVLAWIKVGYPTAAAADPQNAAATLKPIFDGLVTAGVLQDDSSDYVVPAYDRDPRKSPKGTHTVTIVFVSQEVPF